MSLELFQDAQRIVVKVGTSTLTHDTGKLHIRRIEGLVRVLSDLKNEGREIVLVSSGAIGVGVGKMGLVRRPSDPAGRQALAAVGQCELMFMYDKLFSEYGHVVAQVLLTRFDVDNAERKHNVINTFSRLLDLGALPIVNENDTVAIDELVGNNFGDNDTLSAIVAKIVDADALVLLTDIDGLYTDDPHKNPQAQRIDVVHTIDDSVRKLAKGRGSSRGTGGMVTKIAAAQIAMDAGIPCAIVLGEKPHRLYHLFEGTQTGTVFLPSGVE
ncbi:glutamate 5-kinase [Solibaculum mannosilyticum]|uniref:glutamate 5-kinase n=1 Tax=Solibaculum mannosilyticum TaxID=2780922 RepID=UPI0034AE395F